MTFEEIQRTIEFLVQHGAQLDTRLEKLTESVQVFRDSHEQLRETQGTLTASMMRLIELMQESERRNEGRFKIVDERLIALADAQKSTDERLNAVINIFEKHVTGHNHGSPTQ